MTNHYTKRIQLIYPDKRVVSAATIESWYADAVADQSVVSHFTELDDMIWALEDAGFITTAKMPVDNFGFSGPDGG